MKDAVDFHSQSAEIFLNYYSKKKSFKERQSIFEKLIDKYFLIHPASVIDLGCGPGVLSYSLALKGYYVFGIDGSGEMIKICTERKRQFPDLKMNFIKTQIPFNPLEEGITTCKYLISSSVFEYIDDLDATLNMLNKILDNEGVLIISLPNKKSIYRIIERILYKIIKKPEYYKFVKHIFSVEKFNELMSQNNFDVIENIYFGKKNSFFSFLSKILQPKYSNDMFVGVYKKTK